MSAERVRETIPAGPSEADAGCLRTRAARAQGGGEGAGSREGGVCKIQYFFYSERDYVGISGGAGPPGSCSGSCIPVHQVALAERTARCLPSGHRRSSHVTSQDRTIARVSHPMCHLDRSRVPYLIYLCDGLFIWVGGAIHPRVEDPD